MTQASRDTKNPTILGLSAFRWIDSLQSAATALRPTYGFYLPMDARQSPWGNV